MATANIFPEASGTPSGASFELQVEVQTYIRDSFWRGSTVSLPEHVPYFRYFQWTVSSIVWAGSDKALFAAQTYQQLDTVVQYINKHRDQSRTEIADELHKQFFSQSSRECILQSMDLAIRLWMTLHVKLQDIPNEPVLSDTTPLEWKPKQSLRNLIGTTFPKCSKGPAFSTLNTGHIDPRFNVMSLRKLCRVQVSWTRNLLDHLKFDHSMRRLYIYPHKACLLNHLKCRTIYPRALLLESLRTLDLLFPYGDKNTEMWLEEKNQPFYRTSSSYMQARARSLDEFRYWRHQLVELYNVFEQPPVTVAQVWHDRRNPIQWYTFWLAAFIAVLTIVFGSVGTYIGFKQIELAEKSIRISLEPSG